MISCSIISTFIVLITVPHTWSTEPSSSTAEAKPAEATSPEAEGFFQNLTLSHPAGLKVTASDLDYLHVAAIIQIVVGKEFKPGFRANADTMLTSLLRHRHARTTAF
jgi:hypothetical protein